MTEINSTSTSNAEKLVYTGEIAVAQDEYYIRLAEENDEMTRHEKKKKIGLDLNMILLLLRAVLMDGDGDIGEATKRRAKKVRRPSCIQLRGQQETQIVMMTI